LPRVGCLPVISGVGYPGGEHKPGDPEVAARQLLSGLAAGAAPPRRGGPGDGGGHVLSAGGVHPADGEAGGDAGQQVPDAL
jgi:hypothetical protein